MREHWDNLRPNTKRALVVGGVGAALVLAMIYLVPDNRVRPTQTAEQIRAIINDSDTRSLSIEGLAAQLQNLRAELRKSAAERGDLTSQLEQAVRENQQGRLRNDQVEQRLKELEQRAAAPPPPPPAPPPAVMPPPAGPATTSPTPPTPSDQLAAPLPDTAGPGRRPGLPGGSRLASLGPVTAPVASPVVVPGPPPRDRSLGELFAEPTRSPPALGQPPSASGTQAGAAPLAIVSRTGPPPPVPPAAPMPEEGFYLPLGSVLQGHLVTGLDAATGKNASADPFPVLVQLDNLALLPNRFRADMRLCLVLMAGYGQLAAERAYLRGEKLSCIAHDGRVSEVPLKSYAAGEDGKAGLRGRVVTRDGQVIAKALMAGFLQGVSQALKPQSDVSISIDPSTGRINGGNAAASGAMVQGFGSAFAQIADYYIRLAEEVFPVIEVAAGRRIDVVVTDGGELGYADAFPPGSVNRAFKGSQP